MPQVCRLLFVGDIHLGRRPSGLPEAIAADPEQVRQLTPAAGWERCVTTAIEERVDAVVLAGDVVDRADDRFEAYGALERGVARLVGKGIGVLGVAGNHDVRVLPRLADQIPEFRLIGRDGKWEPIDVVGRDGGRVRLLGWSFPREKVERSPIVGLSFEAARGTAVLGVLHCDLGVASSPYAPVARAELEGVPVAGWFLGHVHKPSHELNWPPPSSGAGAASGSRPIGYLGSLTAMDPGEPGQHGPWLVEVVGDRIERCRQLPLAPLRFESEIVPVEGMGDAAGAGLEAELTARILGALERIANRIGEEPLAECGIVSCRLALRGRTEPHRDLRALLAAGRFPREKSAAGGRARLMVERIDDQAQPALDLMTLARSSDPPGLLAQDLLAMAGATGDSGALLQEGRGALERVLACADFAALDRPAVTDVDLRERLERAARELLEDVLAQRQAVGSAP
jgi:hypothetical protein